jgi:AraC-like DNA-binding protein
MRPSKKAASRKHFSTRLQQRYNLTLTNADERAILWLIHAGRHQHARRQTNRTSRITLEYHGQLLTVIYDKQRKCLVTALPPKRLAANATMEATTR